MKKLISTIALTALLVGIRPPLLAGTNPAAQQTATQQANLFGDQANPLQLDADFMAQINVPTQGHFTLKWEAKDRWWRKIVMGDFQQIEIRNGDKLYNSRNVAFTPLRVRELISLIEFAEGPEGLLAKKAKQRVENGVQMTCLQVEREKVKGERHELCVNSATHGILSDEWQELSDERRREQYTEYFDFGGHRYPSKLQLIVSGIRVITANVDTLTTAAFDEKLLVPPKGSHRAPPMCRYETRHSC
ncbi:MAG: hypothetical protein JWO91_3554 [Acidobacteriaceae bacterium]|nr:hypothetical protein [Acidobacteriaceae bacterium]